MEIWKQVILIFNLNKLKLRKKIVLRDDNKFGLSGFKIQFVGRFSRKQRASSIFVQHGCMPLNTLCANINFGSDTIALRNSAITVKI
jgi:ribosomal protein S3